MTEGLLVTLGRAAGLLWRHEALWWPTAGLDALLFLAVVGWLKALLHSVSVGGTGAVVVGWLVTLGLWTVWDARGWAVAGRFVAGEAAGLPAVSRHRRSWTGWLGGTGLLAAARFGLSAGSLVVLLFWLTGGRWDRLLTPLEPLGAAMGSRGALWIVGGAVVLLALGAARRWVAGVAEGWRIAWASGADGLWETFEAASQWARRPRRVRWSRTLARQVIGLSVWILPARVIHPLLLMSDRTALEVRGVVLGVWLVLTAAGWAMARSWLRLADLVAWRQAHPVEAERPVAGALATGSLSGSAEG